MSRVLRVWRVAAVRLEAGPELNSCCFISRHRTLIQTQGHMPVLSPAVPQSTHTHTRTHTLEDKLILGLSRWRVYGPGPEA